MRQVLALPKTFQEVKFVMDKVIHRFWGTRQEYKDGSTVSSNVETPENLALLYALFVEFSSYFEHIFLEHGDKLLNAFGDSTEIILKQYGKKVVIDREANWIFVEDLTDQDWYKLDTQDNKEYLQKKVK
jgi:hypothetical protein